MKIGENVSTIKIFIDSNGFILHGDVYICVYLSRNLFILPHMKIILKLIFLQISFAATAIIRSNDTGMAYMNVTTTGPSKQK